MIIVEPDESLKKTFETLETLNGADGIPKK